jgi:CubicO group peptidase (beta-lactamase class C family)
VADAQAGTTTLSFRGAAIVRRGGDEVLRYAGEPAGAPRVGLADTTRFQLASVSKQCTAAATLRLVDRGVLSVEDRLNRLVEGGPPAWDEITVHQLLCHTAGLVHWRHLEGLDLTDVSVTDDELLGTFHEAPLLAPPGTAYSYSSPGYVLLAHVVERVSGTPYRRFLEDELFGPLAMSSTFAGNADGRGDLAVPTHDGSEVTTFELDVIGKGAGDVWSTLDDQVAWNVALRDGRVLSEGSTRAMRTVQTTMTEHVEGVDLDGYGYGLVVGRVLGRPLVFHTGDNAGFVSLNAWLADEDTQVVLLSNDTATDLQGLGVQLLATALGA